MLHKFARYVAASTVLLILAGSFVTSTDSGLSVPDWPTTYGWNMFTFPPSKVGRRHLLRTRPPAHRQHGRLSDDHPGRVDLVRGLAAMAALVRLGALASVVAQGILGGLTVIYFLPAPVSTAHAGLAEIFFCMTVAIALFTSPGWIEGYGDAGWRIARSARRHHVDRRHLHADLVGATMRHTGAGLAIPDFPWMFGHVIPDHWSAAIAVHFAHRLGALIVIAMVFATSLYVWRRHQDRPSWRGRRRSSCFSSSSR
jgi:cytochrome c oxidase assembly protein subunit 15